MIGTRFQPFPISSINMPTTPTETAQTSTNLPSRGLRFSFVLPLLLVATVGCSKFDLRGNIPWKTTSHEPKIPGRITALWTHTILEQPGKRGIRGFGGRLMFHDREGEAPVIVEGDLVVYAFDDTDGPTSHPEKKFVFTPADLPSHHSESRLGHSYSLWLPWDEIGGPPRKISLVVRFTPQGAGTVMSESAHVLLPGIDPEVKQEIQQAAARFREKQKELKAAAAVSPIPTDADQSGISQASGTLDPAQRNARVIRQPNGLDVITLDASPNLGQLIQSYPPQSQETAPRTNAVPTLPPNAALPGQTTAPGSVPPIKASLAERAAARRPTRFAQSRHRARALGGPLTAPGREDPIPAPSAPPSDPSAQLAPR